jgi:hypothetical protein
MTLWHIKNNKYLSLFRIIVEVQIRIQLLQHLDHVLIHFLLLRHHYLPLIIAEKKMKEIQNILFIAITPCQIFQNLMKPQ